MCLVAPLFKKEKRCKSLNFKEVQGFFFVCSGKEKADYILDILNEV